MGVKGLESFVRENRTSLTKTITLPPIDEDLLSSNGATESRVPIIVDAWGIIFKLYLDTLPWTSGGEYLRYYKLVKKLVLSWRKVGLEPTFVFDGAAPPEKHNTTLSRAAEKLLSCQLFYTTSIPSRSSPSFSKGKVVLPFFASQAFTFALHRLGVKTHFVPAGEADGICVSMAEKAGGYIFGRDSDFIILIGKTERVKGYVPIDMLNWIEGPTPVKQETIPASNTNKYVPPGLRNQAQASDFFQPVSNGRRNTSHNGGHSNFTNRQTSMIPSSTLKNPSLVLTFIPPQALRHRLRIPSTHLPLFASLCGTDYTPPNITQQFFEPSLSIFQKIEKVARILREQLFTPQPPHPPRRNGSSTNSSRSSSNSDYNPGDQVVDLVKKVIKKLCIYPFDTEQSLDDTVNLIIESALQYSLPSIGICCDTYPFCGELDLSLGCQTPIILDENFLPVKPNATNQKRTGKEEYSKAQKLGLVGTIVHGWLYPDRMYQWQVLEDISGPCLKASEGVKDIRRKAWSIADEGLDGLRWVRSQPIDEDKPEVKQVEKVDIVVDQDKGDEELREILGVPQSETSSESGLLQSESSTLVDQDLDKAALEIPQVATRPIREMTEYLRQGSTAKIIASPLPLPPVVPLQEGDSPICLKPLQERLQIYLQSLHSDIPSIRSLPISLQPLVSLIRFCVIDASKRSYGKTDHNKWRRDEVIAVLRSCIGIYTMWKREMNCEEQSHKGKNKHHTGGEDGGKLYPLLETRNCNLIAQLGSVWSDCHILAQALLLLPEIAIPPNTLPLNNEQTEGGVAAEGKSVEEELGTTHIIPFIFFSGINLHLLLSKTEPSSQSGWKWSNEEENLYQICWKALIDNLDEGCIIGLNQPTKTSKEGEVKIGQHIKFDEDGEEEEVGIVGHDQEQNGSGKKNKKKKRRKSSSGSGKSAGAGNGGRFGALEGLMD